MASIEYLETCTSDFFGGASGHVFAVPVSPLTTLEELQNDLENDINATLDEDPFESEQDFRIKLAAAIGVFTREYPFDTVGSDVPVADGYVVVTKGSGYALCEGTEDDYGHVEITDFIQQFNTREQAAWLSQSLTENLDEYETVYCYFTLVE